MKNRAVLAGGAVVLVVVLGWYMFLYKPKGKELSDTRAKVEQLASEQQKLEADLARLQELDRNRPLRVAERQRLAGLIPERDELAGFIIAADEIATRSGLRFVSITPSEPVAGADGVPSVITLSMTLEGTFFQLLDYVGRLENLRRLVVVDTLNVTVVGTGEANGSIVPFLDVAITARMFTTAPPPGAPGAATTTTAPPAVVTTTAPVTSTTVAGATTPAPAVTTTIPAATATTGGA